MMDVADWEDSVHCDGDENYVLQMNVCSASEVSSLVFLFPAFKLLLKVLKGLLTKQILLFKSY